MQFSLSLSLSLSLILPMLVLIPSFQDPSSNVRLKLCSLLSQLKTIILLPTDRDKQQMFESTISKLLMDKDSDTIAAVNCAVKEMAKINYRIQSVRDTYMHTATLHMCIYTMVGLG